MKIWQCRNRKCRDCYYGMQREYFEGTFIHCHRYPKTIEKHPNSCCGEYKKAEMVKQKKK